MMSASLKRISGGAMFSVPVCFLIELWRGAYDLLGFTLYDKTGPK